VAGVRVLLLIRHATTPSTRSAAFTPGDEPLDDRGREQARALGAVLPANAEALCSPLVRGRTLVEVNADDRGGVAAWFSDPDARPHGGETLRELATRVASWVDSQAELNGRAVVITHGGVVKTALVHALGTPFDVFWRIDVAPLAVTELHATDGRWTIARVNCAAQSPN
jgi:broad specificity phosphatase PhoE